ncbi:DUF6082 family protein [Streptomyces kroppenstedtii]|uniref:DUF6082 family protein n=1 Tax=Streptomyces kroppenstedtii TaxID=3051181 RepID=UPI0028D2E1BA|nr:DUF6082 family protein [Streptomyces sp. DSM 40484]
MLKALLLEGMSSSYHRAGGMRMLYMGLWKKRILWAAAGLGVLALVACSPFILRAAAPAGMDWGKLSEVSQAYGAVAVLFSAAAFLGAVISIWHQAKQTRIMHEEIRSSMHKELILRALDDESLMYCWEPPPIPCTFLEVRQHTFCNLIYRLWLTDYLVGRMTLEATRITLEVHFKGEVARRHWKIYGQQWNDWGKANANGREKEFVSLTQRVYEMAVASGSPVAANSYYEPPQV